MVIVLCVFSILFLIIVNEVSVHGFKTNVTIVYPKINMPKLIDYRTTRREVNVEKVVKFFKKLEDKHEWHTDGGKAVTPCSFKWDSRKKHSADWPNNDNDGHRCFVDSFTSWFPDGTNFSSKPSHFLIFATPCDFNDNLTKSFANRVDELKNTTVVLIVVCLMNMNTGQLTNPAAYTNMYAAVADQRVHFLNYTNDDTKLTEELLRLLPNQTIVVNNCDYKNKTSDCSMNTTIMICFKVQFPTITNDKTDMHGIPCPKNFTLPCDEFECACDKNPWMNGTCSVTCGNGTQTPWRNVSQNPTCTETDEPKPCSTEICSSTQMPQGTQSASSFLLQSSSNSTYIHLKQGSHMKEHDSFLVIIAATVGGLIFIVLVIIILIVVLLRHRAKNKKYVTVIQGKKKIATVQGKKVKAVQQNQKQGSKTAAHPHTAGDSTDPGLSKNRGIKVDLKVHEGSRTHSK